MSPMEVEMNAVQWCTKCGQRFSYEEIAKATACPACGSVGIPCSTDKDFLLQINWHELKILVIWAERWAGHIDDGDGSDLGTVRSIARRLEEQADCGPLMLVGEIMQLHEHFDGVETNVPAQPMVVVNGPGAVGHSREPGKVEG